MEQHGFHMLLNGIDTIQCAYFLLPEGSGGIDFDLLGKERESIRTLRRKESLPVKLGNGEFLLQGYGSSSGYPFVMTNADFRIEFGEFNSPSFFVTFQSSALWRESASLLHVKFLEWADSVHYLPYKEESLSRVDFCFDYHLPEIDFDESHFVSRSVKDSKYRENGRLQSLTYGKGSVVMRFYDKVAEIEQQSNKAWFHKLWGQEKDIWRIEWQVRKDVLRQFGIRTFHDLEELKGDLLAYLGKEHDSLRVKNKDSNTSRWPLHPLWQDLLSQISRFDCFGIDRIDGRAAVLEERLTRMAISLYGYMKRVAAIKCVQERKDKMLLGDTFESIRRRILNIHEPFSWELDVKRRTKEIQLGKW